MASNYNIRKEFLGESSAFRNQGMFNPALDEPTYLTFKLDFFSDEMLTEQSFLYDSIPQGLFCLGKQGSGLGSRNDAENWNPDLSSVQNFISKFEEKKMFTPSFFIKDRAYSALEYLYSRNEDFRCYMLAKFLKGWNDLQTRYQYYFQEIEGLDELFKSDPSKGQKIEKSHTITIKCLEGIDQKVKMLLSLYKAAAWDDHYQRWILPDIYRYFKLDIYISEIRTFHQSVYANPIDPDGLYSKSLISSLYDNNGALAKAIDRFAGKVVDKITGKVLTTLNDWTNGGINSNAKEDNFILGVVKGFVPVTCLRCSLCDFDINYNTYQNGYSINNDQMETTSIKVRVRQAEEIHNWRIFPPYRNLMNDSERKLGQEALKNLAKISDLSDQFFNETINMVNVDKFHVYTDTIAGGWIMDGINKIVESVTSGDGVLDKVYNGYQTVRDALAHKKAVEGNYKTFAATEGDIGEPNLLDDADTVNQRTKKSKAVEDSSRYVSGRDNTRPKPYGSHGAANMFNALASYDPSTYSYVVAVAHKFELDSSYGIIKIQPRDKDRSLATDLDGDSSVRHSAMSHLVYRGADDGDDWNPQDASRFEVPEMIRISQDTILDQIVDGTLTYRDLMQFRPEIQRAGTDSKATDNDSILPVMPEISDKPDELGYLIDVNQGPDRSIATNLDNGTGWDYTNYSAMQSLNYGGDRSLATDLDGIAPAQMQDLPHPETDSFATDTSIPMSSLQGMSNDIDRSLATDLDDDPVRTMTDTVSHIDRSLATDLDSAPDTVNLVKIEILDDLSLATDLSNDLVWSSIQASIMQVGATYPILSLATDPSAFIGGLSENTIGSEIEDRSLATDLDGLFGGIAEGNLITVEDRSLATDLDNEPTSIWLRSEISKMTWIRQPYDKSAATDLDDEHVLDDYDRNKYENLQKKIDRSLATDLDNSVYWDYEMKKRMLYLEPILDRSEATDLDNSVNWSSHMSTVLQFGNNIDPNNPLPLSKANDLESELSLVSTAKDIDRSLATDLDDDPSDGGIKTNISDLQSAQETNVDLKSEDEKRKSMTHLSQETSLFDQIAMQTLKPESSKPSDIEGPRIEGIESKPREIQGQDLFNQIAMSLSAATEPSEISISPIETIDRSLATDLDNSPSITNVSNGFSESDNSREKTIEGKYVIDENMPIRDLIEVYLIGQAKKKETIEGPKLQEENKRKVTIL